VVDKMCLFLALFPEGMKFMWLCYCMPVFLLVVLTTSTIRNLKDVNPETDSIYAKAVENSKV